MNILIDKDDVLYQFTKQWYKRHNADPLSTHTLLVEEKTEYEQEQRCKDNSCNAGLFDYFKESGIWLVGDPVPNAIKITQKWIDLGHELVVITRVMDGRGAHPSMVWLERCYPHIPDVMMVTTAIKHWAAADILIDDSSTNHTGFRGISLLMDRPWNKLNKRLPRATDWLHLDRILARIEVLLEAYQENEDWLYEFQYHKVIEKRIKDEIDQGLL